MPFLQQHPDSLRGDVRPLPDPELGSDLTQQVQNRVPVLPVLQLDPVVLSRHSNTGEPGEVVKDWSIDFLLSDVRRNQPCKICTQSPFTSSSARPSCQWEPSCFRTRPGSGRSGRSSRAAASPPSKPTGTFNTLNILQDHSAHKSLRAWQSNKLWTKKLFCRSYSYLACGNPCQRSRVVYLTSWGQIV